MDAIGIASALDYALEHDLPTMLWGDTGIGKTDLVKQAGARAGRQVRTITPATYESVDLRGLPVDRGDRVDWTRPDFVADLFNMGAEPVLFVDEINTNKALEVPLMQLILTRSIGPHKLPEGTRIVCAGNRTTDRAAAQRMGKALEDRLFHLDYEASLDSWLPWAATNGVHPAIIAFLRWRGKDSPGRPGLFIWRSKESQDMRSRPGPRAWAACSPVVDAPAALRFAFMSGRVGEAAAVEFEGFLDVWKNLPPIPQIIAKPDTCKIPSELSLQYAVSVALGHAADPVNIAAICQYMGRVGAEFQTVTMTDAVRRRADIAETPAYIRWAAQNSHLAI